MKDALQNALTSIVTFVPKLVGFILILLIGLFIAKAIANDLAPKLNGGWGFVTRPSRTPSADRASPLVVRASAPAAGRPEE